MTRLLKTAVGVGFALALATATSMATEDRFIYVDRMPAMQGEPESKQAYEDP